MLLLELLVGLDPLRGDSDHRRLQAPHVIGPLRVRAELLGADGRVVPGVEEQHHPFSEVIGEPERPVGAVELEVGCAIADFMGAHGRTMLQR